MADDFGLPFDVGSVESGIEQVPENIDLDALLALGDVEETGNKGSGKMRQAKVAEVLTDANVDDPHISVPTREVAYVLQVAAMVSSAGENTFEGKSVAIKVETGVAKFLLSDNKRHVEKDVKLINEDNQFTGFIAFSAGTIARIIKVCPSVFTIVEREGDDGKSRYSLLVHGGEISLDLINLDESKFVKSYPVANASSYVRQSIMGVIKRLYTFASTAMRLGKSIDFLGDTVQSSPMNALAKIKFDETYPKFRLPLTDARILQTLCVQDDSDTIKISSDGKIFEGSRFRFKTESLAVSPSSFDDVAEAMFEGVGVVANLKHLIQVTDLSCGLDTSTGNLRFNYSSAGYLQAVVLTKRENNTLLIDSEGAEVIPLEAGIDIPSFNLKSALTIFTGDTVLVRVTTNGLAIQSLDDGGRVHVSILGREAKK